MRLYLYPHELLKLVDIAKSIRIMYDLKCIFIGNGYADFIFKHNISYYDQEHITDLIGYTLMY